MISEEWYEARDLLVEALVRNGRGAEPATLRLAELTVRLEDRHSPASPRLADALQNLADVRFESGEFVVASELNRLVVALREQAPQPDRLGLADAFDQLARALAWSDRSDEALRVLERATALKIAARGADTPELVRTLEIRGMLLQRTGQHALARMALERALALQRSAGEDHPQTAAVLTLLGLQFWLEGDLLQSKELCRQALSVAERSLRGDHPEIASYLRNLAVPVAELGDLAAARLLRTRALAIAEPALGKDHLSVGVLVNDLAVSFTLEGDLAAARVLYERALAIYQRRLGRNSPLTTIVVLNLAIVNAGLTDYVSARRQFNEVIESWERLLKPDHPNVARGLTFLAEMLSSQGLDAEAKPLYEKALAIREQPAARNQRDIARTLGTLATTEFKLGNLERALELSSRAIALLDASDDPNGRRTADALLRHGSLLTATGELVAAEASYSRALSIYRRVLGADHISVADAQLSLAEALVAQFRAASAVEAALAGEDTSRNSLRLTLRYLPEPQALSYGARRPRTLDLALAAVEGTPAKASEVFDRVILGRSLVLDEIAARHREVAANDSGIAPLRQALISARQRLANLVVKGPGQMSSERYLAIVEEARRDKVQAERALAETSAAFSGELKRSSVGLAQVGAVLPQRSALVSLVRYEAIDRAKAIPSALPVNAGATREPYSARRTAAYIAFVLRQGESDPIAVPLGEAAIIDEQVARWRTETVAWLSRAPGAPKSAERSLRVIGDELRRRVWDPVAAHLEGVDQVFVVPDGSLNLVPFAALPIGKIDYLLERGPTIHYLSAERDLVPTSGQTAVGEGLLALGGPSFEDGSLFTKLAKPVSAPRSNHQSRAQGPFTVPGADPSAVSAGSFRGSVSHCLSFQSLDFDPLPGSRAEANHVADLWKEFGQVSTGSANSARVLVGRAADERSFKELSPGHRVLHLATHGFFLGSECASALGGTRSVGGLAARKKASTASQTKTAMKTASTAPSAAAGENPLLLSGLAMAGANRRAAATGQEEDGILTAEEVASLDLSGVEWAVLSACDTGLGEIKVGEGVFGLRRAFQIAGAHTVIMSLWSVEDRAAMRWMRALYEGRLGKKLDTATAVREASLTVLRQRRARGQSTHPFYWAGFVASGDWR